MLIIVGIGIWIIETRAAKNDETMPETIESIDTLKRNPKICNCAFPDNWREDGICEGCEGYIT